MTDTDTPKRLTDWPALHSRLCRQLLAAADSVTCPSCKRRLHAVEMRRQSDPRGPIIMPWVDSSGDARCPHCLGALDPHAAVARVIDEAGDLLALLLQRVDSSPVTGHIKKALSELDKARGACDG